MPTTAMIRAAAVSIAALAGTTATVSIQSAVAQTIVSETHLQVMIDLNCTGNSCTGDFAAPGAGRRRQQHVTRVTCLIAATGKSFVDFGAIALRDKDTDLLRQFLPFEGAQKDTHSVNQAVDMLVVGPQHLRVGLFLLDPAVASVAQCTATGKSIRLE